jgi:hypothetical protein
VTAETHFVQAGDGPVLIGAGADTLACACGQVLIQGFDSQRFLAIGLRCRRCGTLTTTERLPERELPPRSAIVATPSAEPRQEAMTVPSGVTVVGQAEMARWQAMFQPASPDHVYRIGPDLLDQADHAFGARLAETPANHPLGIAARFLRDAMASQSPAHLADPATASAVVQVVGFLHFAATWSGHPLFPAMLATAGARGFDLHGLTPFAAAHCLMMMGNRVRFPQPTGYPERIEDFELVSGLADTVNVHVEVFDRFEYPAGRPWDPASLLAAVTELVSAAQGRINLRNPGLLVLSPGIAMAEFDEALILAVKEAVAALGRRNRGLMAVAPVTLRLQVLPDPTTVRFGYGIFPIQNRHYRGESAIGLGA